MIRSPRRAIWQREELLHLLSLSATLAGLCVTGVTLFHTFGKSLVTQTIADDVLAVSALMFLISAYSIFWALRSHSTRLKQLLEWVADAMFLLALTGMVTSGFIMVYTVW